MPWIGLLQIVGLSWAAEYLEIIKFNRIGQIMPMYTATPEDDWTRRGATTPNLLVADGKLTVSFVLAKTDCCYRSVRHGAAILPNRRTRSGWWVGHRLHLIRIRRCNRLIPGERDAQPQAMPRNIQAKWPLSQFRQIREAGTDQTNGIISVQEYWILIR